ncbi:GAP1-N2 domain-containing protein [Nocardiopsis salina]|uniref:GAP1-N2 domain-containing protein n=1 Tax=Nocardiopsis salina TaxID=245836 RepID=UPI000688DF89|nr:hypothetical protein [Nocardiopsis salina]
MAFEVATYTDVTSSEAIDGVDGFNFQAVSPGLTGEDRQRIREGLLHRVVPSWALGHDPLDHPPTCAFTVEGGRSYLALGRSTGTTNSGRPGNQVTQVIAASDPDDFVPYRPAQLYGARRWELEKAPGPELDPWVTPLEIRPEFEADALRSLVVDDEWATRVLPHFLTMVDEAAGPEPVKAVLLHTDLDTVMRWIALGTLFVDPERAQTLRFRALVDDPWRADAALVGVSPEFGPVDLDSANVLDLVGRTVPGIEPSGAAQARAELFLGHDAADALSAVETARRWEPALGPVASLDAARIVAVPGVDTGGARAWRTAVSAIDGLAGAGQEDDLALYGEELGDVAVTHGPTTDEEFTLAGRAVHSTHALGLDEVACGVLVPVLEALTAAPECAGAFARELSGAEKPLEWGSEEERSAAGAFLDNVFGSAPGDALPDLMEAARSIGAPLSQARLDEAVDELAKLWAGDPELGRDRWKRGPPPARRRLRGRRTRDRGRRAPRRLGPPRAGGRRPRTAWLGAGRPHRSTARGRTPRRGRLRAVRARRGMAVGHGRRPGGTGPRAVGGLDLPPRVLRGPGPEPDRGPGRYPQDRHGHRPGHGRLGAAPGGPHERAGPLAGGPCSRSRPRQGRPRCRARAGAGR